MIRLGVALRSSSLGDHVIQYEPREIGYLTARQWARAKRMTVQEMAAGYDCANRLRRNEAVEDITAGMPFRREMVVWQWAIKVMHETGWECIRGRGWRRRKAQSRRLKDDEVRDIRARRSDKVEAVAQSYDVSTDLIYRIWRREIYRDVDPPE